MEQIFKTLSEIEERAVRMIEHANNTKKELAAQAEARIQKYDKEQEEATLALIAARKEELDRQLKEELASQKNAADELMAGMQKEYDDNHTAIAGRIFEQLIC